MKVVINKCWGGFGLSKEAFEYLGLEWDGFGCAEIERHNSKLVECVEKLGDKANGRFASLEVVEIPDDVEYEIDNYDGMETIHEKHRIWN